MQASLYVHVPFCASKCSYCDFFSMPRAPAEADAFVDAVLAEASYYKRTLGIESWRTVYVGGGTPTLLPERCLSKLLLGISRQGLSPSCEVTVEANPETVTGSLLSVLQDSGAGRLSLGIQSMDDAALRVLGRHCTAAKNRAALETAAAVWKGRLSLDCMAGLPLQDDEAFMRSLSEVLRAGAGHVSLYALSLEEGTPLSRAVAEGRVPWKSDDADRQWLLGRDALISAGLRQYEVSNFARDGEESAHNAGYWAQENYVGVGPGACGTLYPWSCGGERPLRWTNTQDAASWLRFWLSPEHPQKNAGAVRETETLSPETLSFEFLMLGLRTRLGVSEETYRSRFSGVAPWNGDLGSRLSASSWWRSFLSDGRALCLDGPDGRRYALSGGGLLLLTPLLSSLC